MNHWSTFYQKKLEISETMRTIIELCQKHEIMMGVITNGPSQHQWNKVKALKVMEFIPEEYIFVSGDIGVAKPQIGIFQPVEKACFGIKSEQAFAFGMEKTEARKRNHAQGPLSGSSPERDFSVSTSKWPVSLNSWQQI